MSPFPFWGFTQPLSSPFPDVCGGHPSCPLEGAMALCFALTNEMGTDMMWVTYEWRRVRVSVQFPTLFPPAATHEGVFMMRRRSQRSKRPERRSPSQEGGGSQITVGSGEMSLRVSSP